MVDFLPFGWGAWIFLSLYLSSLLLIGWLSFNARKENTLKDFYLAGSGFGFIVLVLTLYATQYSGNALFGFTGAAYRIGFAWIMSVHFMLAIMIFYLLYAPKLYVLAQRKTYVTPVDFIGDRFDSKALCLIASLVMIFALSNYLLAQLMAIGRALQGLAGAQGDIAYNYGVVVLALIMVIYGTLGGIRAVAWTDVIQGTVLMVGFLTLLVLLYREFGPLSLATEQILGSADAGKITPPEVPRLREWASYVVISGMGGALYPQAIQRIYAARSGRVLNQSLAVMAFLPFTTVLIAVITGIYALAYLPGLEGASTDQVLSRLFRVIQAGSVFGYWLVVLMFGAVLAAIMSTADSAMLSISSMFTKDIYAVYFRPGAAEGELTRIGKRCSWIIVAALAALAIALKNHASLVSLIDRKFDLLVQLAPCFILGVRSLRLNTTAVLAGLVAGLTVSLVLAFGPFDFVVRGKVWGLHPGLFGLALNLLIVAAGSALAKRDR